MRKITKEAYNAFINKQRFTKKNTKVRIEEGEANMYLHDNLIAKTINGDIWISDGNYKPSRTTLERLKAFPNIKLRILKKEFIINEKMKWDGEWFKIN
jgi:hypothetical protein